jgi:hypothetical protein
MPHRTLRLAALVIALPFTATAALADGDCTKEPKDKWMKEADLKARIDAAGYTKYDKVLVSGTCYEIYGYNKDGKMVEVYFNPIDGKVVKEEVEDDKDDKK